LVPEQSGAACRAHPMPEDTRHTNAHHPAPPRRSVAVAPAGAGETSPRPAGSPTPTSGSAERAPRSAGGDSGSRQIALAKPNPDVRKSRAPAPAPVEVSASAVKQSEEDHHKPPRTEVRGYRIERELGRGGMGAVYLALQLSLDRPVALKVMSKRWAHDPVFVARFTREAYAAAQLSHPNIVQIPDIGEVDGARFFSMEYVRGQSLAEVLRKNGKLDPETAVGYVLQAARGLKHAHSRGMIHRDIKPDNLLLDEQGLVKVADLGLVKTPTTTRADDILPPSLTSGLG